MGQWSPSRGELARPPPDPYVLLHPQKGYGLVSTRSTLNLHALQVALVMISVLFYAGKRSISNGFGGKRSSEIKSARHDRR